MNHDPDQLRSFFDQLSLAGPVEPFLVFADWLQGQGDPWGELIAVQCQPHTLELVELGARLLALISARLCPHDPVVEVSWQRGFVSVLAFSDTRGATWLADELARLFALPAVVLCREVSFRDGDLGDEHVRDLMRVRERLVALDRLDLEGNWFTPPTVRALRNAFPKAQLDRQRGSDEDRPDRALFVKSWDERGE